MPNAVIVLTRDSVVEWLNRITVAPITRTIRHIKTEVKFEPADGVPTSCVAALDNIFTIQRISLSDVIAVAGRDKMVLIFEAIRYAFDVPDSIAGLPHILHTTEMSSVPIIRATRASQLRAGQYAIAMTATADAGVFALLPQLEDDIYLRLERVTPGRSGKSNPISGVLAEASTLLFGPIAPL